MDTPICFIDTETTGLHPGRLPWEIAVILRHSDGAQQEWVWHVEDVDLSDADPFGLKVGRFYARHRQYGGFTTDPGRGDPLLMAEAAIASALHALTRGAHIVGAVPNFDTETLAPMLRRHRFLPGWHYHLIDVETLAIGYLAGQGKPLPDLPWSSEELSAAVGVEPASPEERHTALGDARWAMRIYDAVTGRPGTVSDPQPPPG